MGEVRGRGRDVEAGAAANGSGWAEVEWIRAAHDDCCCCCGEGLYDIALNAF